SGLLRAGDLEGKLGKTLLVHNVPKIAAERVLLVGLGKERDFNEAAYRTAVAAAAKALRSTGATDALVTLTDTPLKKRDTAWKVEQAVLAFADAAYRFDRLKSRPPEDKRGLRKVLLQVTGRSESAEAQGAIERGQAIA